MTYSEKLRDPRWQKRRLEILERDAFSCRCCADATTTLHVHHLSYSGNPWDAPPDQLIALCEHCHWIVTQLKADISYLDSRPITIAYKTFLEGGDAILFFQHSDIVYLIQASNKNCRLVAAFPDACFRDIVQSIVNNWQIDHKDLIDQSPILYGA